MSIRKRGDTYVCDFAKNGIRIRKGGFSTKSEAKAFETECEIKYRQGNLLTSETNKTLFRDYLKKFIENRYIDKAKNEFLKSPYYKNALLAKSLFDYFGNMLINKISKTDIESYIAGRRDNDKVKASSINRTLAILSASLNSAVDDGFIYFNPFKKIGMLKSNNKRDRIMSFDEERRLMEVAPEHLKSIVKFVLNTGLRCNEVLRLMWSDIDIEKRIATVKNTKNGKDFTFPLNDTAVNILKEIRKASANFFVFTYRGNKIRYIKNSFKSVCDKIKILFCIVV